MSFCQRLSRKMMSIRPSLLTSLLDTESGEKPRKGEIVCVVNVPLPLLNKIFAFPKKESTTMISDFLSPSTSLDIIASKKKPFL